MNVYMKRLFGVVISISMAFVLAACGNKATQETVEVETSKINDSDSQDEEVTSVYTVTLNPDGMGEVAYKEGLDAQFTADDDYFQTCEIGVDEPTTYTFSARTNEEGWSFVKWTKDGEDYAAEPTVIHDIEDSADFKAVFEYFDGNVVYDYGTSDIYSKEDMDSAIDVIMDEFNTWEGYELHSIRYASDDFNSDANLSWLNELDGEHNFTECIEFLSDYRTPLEGNEVVSANCIYKDWTWCLAREDGGQWVLVSYGY